MTEQERSIVRTPVIAGNWKMNKTGSEGEEFVSGLRYLMGAVDDREVVVAPPFTALQDAVRAAEGSPISISISAQDVFWEPKGAYTGEVSVGMLVAMGVDRCIVGHSERRGYFGETDESVARKVGALLAAGLGPIMCVGEDEQERERGLTEEVLGRQVPAGLAQVPAEQAGLLCVAYEPIWAIGTGRTATPEMAQEAVAFVREQVAAVLGDEAAQVIRILYGGSVTPENIDELMAEDDIDGALVGGASLKADSFARIVRFEKL